MKSGILIVFLKIIVVSLFSHAFTVSSESDIHKYMTRDEILSVFNTAHDSVPEYEVIPVIRKENSMHLQLPVFGRNLTLYLEPTDHVLLGENTPVYTAIKDNSRPFGIKYDILENAWLENVRTYQDPKNMAAVTIHKNADGKINVDGTIGDNMIIKPLPSRFQKKSFPHHYASGFKNQPNFPLYNRNEGATRHVIYKPNKHPIIETIHTIKKVKDAIWNNLFNFSRNNRYKRTTLDTVYPQLLIIVDHETYKLHGKNIKALTKYMAAFWNGVDLRYRDMEDPKVRLNIAGLIIPMEEGAAPYMEYYRKGQNLIEDKRTILALGQYLYKEKRFSSDMFDIAVGITSLDMCEMESNVCNPLSRGLGYYGGACKRKVHNFDMSVALIEDSGGFEGIVTAAHEIGHVLGAPHDGDDSPNYIGGPGAKSCDWNNGYLMSSVRRDSKGLHWSSCSIEAMRYFVKKEAHCLRNKPVIVKPHQKLLPGKLLSREEQCRRTMNMTECKITKNECGALWCVKPGGTSNCVSKRAPAEGSSCSVGGICLDGYCVLEPRELISISDQQIQIL